VQGQEIENPPTGVVLGQRILAPRQEALIQTVTEVRDPRAMEVMEDAGVDSRPVIYGHAPASDGWVTS
jgi:hypothetical protein